MAKDPGSMLQSFLECPPGWTTEPGPLSEVVLSSRVRLARNLDALPFPSRSTPDQRQAVVRRVQAAAEHIEPLCTAAYFSADDLEAGDLEFLLERRLISRDLAAGDRHRGVLVVDDESLSVMVNEEDHLRLQGLRSGFRLGEALDLVNGVDDRFDSVLGYSYSDKLGYLTACPTNVGTGMRASVLVHLPALHITGETRRVIQGAAAMGLAVRGFYGEGSEMMGNFVQISNHATLGRGESDIVRELADKVHRIIESEEQARESLWASARIQIEDKVYRAYGILRHARTMKAAEVLNLASAVRFGLTLDLPGLCPAEVLNEVLLFSQPGHVGRKFGGSPGKAERRELRAALIRDRLASIPNPEGRDQEESTG